MDSQSSFLFGLLASQSVHMSDVFLQQITERMKNNPQLTPEQIAVDLGWLSPDQEKTIRQQIKDLVTSVSSVPSDDGLDSLDTPLPPRPKRSHNLDRLKTLAATKSPSIDERNYQRISVHGQGGLGKVWLAKDVRLQRTVALKELRPELGADNDLRRRFLQEARITGRLDHPGIVSIYDLENGNDTVPPFYTMPLIHGQTLQELVTAYHRSNAESENQRTPTLRDLLQIFTQVCNTLAYAHSRGVIHRDLKGSNILVGDFGQVIVLDWGLAREKGESTELLRIENLQLTMQTQQGEVMGTLPYMSPEQATGQTNTMDHRSDIYSLGVILFEILTGRLPFIFQPNHSSDKRQQVIDFIQRVEQSLPPSPRSLQKDIAGALNAICLKSLAKKPVDRYQSAKDLAKDIQQWLADEPVSVYRDPVHVRLGRWAKRHRTMVTTLSSVVMVAFISLIVGLALLGREQAKTVLAAERAKRNYEKARSAIDTFYVQVSENRLLNEPGMQPLRQELLSTAKDYYESFLSEAQGNQATANDDLRKTLYQLSGVTRDLGQFDDAIAYLDKAISLTSTEHDNDTFFLAQCWTRKGQCQQLNKKTVEAQTSYEKALQILENDPSDSTAVKVQDLLGKLHGNLGILMQNSAIPGNQDAKELLVKAEKNLRRSADIHQELWRSEPENNERIRELVGSCTNLAQFLAATDRNESIKIMQQLLAVQEQQNADEANKIDPKIRRARTYNTLGVLLGSSEDALAMLQKARALSSQIKNENPRLISVQQDLGNIHLNLGSYYYRKSNATDGLAKSTLINQSDQEYQEALRLFQRLETLHPKNTRFVTDVGMVQSSLGNLWYASDFDQAGKWYESAIATLGHIPKDKQSKNTQLSLGYAHWGLAEIHSSKSRWREALDEWYETAKAKAIFDEQSWQSITEGIINTLKQIPEAQRTNANLLEARRRLRDMPQLQALRSRFDDL